MASGLALLTAAVDAGETLYADTLASGRDGLRRQLRTARDVWDGLGADAGHEARRLDGALARWHTYEDGRRRLDAWLEEAGGERQRDTLANTLAEKKALLQEEKVGFFGTDPVGL